jgi:hypothetical protein
MSALEAFFAVVGVVAVVGLLAVIVPAVRRHLGRLADERVEEDVAAPYREGLHTAIRIQRVAQDLEAQMYAEAAKHVGLVPRPHD